MAAKIMKCPVCGEQFDVNSTPYCHKNRRYHHVSCFKQKYPNEELNVVYPPPPPQEKKVEESTPIKKVEKPKPIKKETKKKPDYKVCYYCKEQIDINSEEWRKPVVNRYAHLKCFQENYKEDDEYIDKMYGYLTSIGFSYDFTQCEKQRISYIRKMGYSNEGIYNALQYHYGVNKGSFAQSGRRIGIVPYVYDEAQAYFRELEKRKKQISKNLISQVTQSKKEIKIKEPEKPIDKGYIDLDTLGGEE